MSLPTSAFELAKPWIPTHTHTHTHQTQKRTRAIPRLLAPKWPSKWAHCAVCNRFLRAVCTLCGWSKKMCKPRCALRNLHPFCPVDTLVTSCPNKSADRAAHCAICILVLARCHPCHIVPTKCKIASFFVLPTASAPFPRGLLR